MESIKDLREQITFERITRAEHLGGFGAPDDGDPVDAEQSTASDTPPDAFERIGGVFERLGYAAGIDISFIELLAGHIVLLDQQVADLRQQVDDLRR